MRKKFLAAAFVLLVVAALVGGSRFLQGEERPAQVSVKGTVVDMHCYVVRGAADAEHAGCSNACLARGVPAGFLAEDGTLYLLLDEKPFSVKDRVAGLAGVPATVTGSLVVRGGVKGIQMKSIEKVAQPSS